MTRDPGPGASAIGSTRHRRESHTPALTQQANVVLNGRQKSIFELADRAVDLPRDFGGVTSPPRLFHTI